MMKPKRVIKITLITTLLIILAVRLAIPIGSTIVLNKILPQILKTDASIGYMSMMLVRGKIMAGMIKVKQPDGFGDGKLLSLRRLSLDLDLSSLKNKTKVVQSIYIKKPLITLIRDTNGVLNVSAIIPESETNKPPEEKSQPSDISIVINKIKIDDLTLSYTDLTCDPPLTINMREGSISATNIVISSVTNIPQQLVSSIIMTAVLKQKDANDAYLGLTVRTSEFGAAIPALNMLTRCGGFELHSLGGMLYPGTVKLLGGTCVDIYMDLAMASDVLDCKIDLKSKSSSLKAMIGGTPRKPKIDKSTPLGSIIGRPGSAIGNLLKDTGGAGKQIVVGAGKTVAAAGKGAVKVVGNVGKGIFDTAKGVVTLNFKDVRKGVNKTTVGTVKTTAKTVGNTASAAAAGISDAGHSISGHERRDDWRNNSRDRWESTWQESLIKIRKMPYPKP